MALTRHFVLQELGARLAELSARAQVIFSAACAERMAAVGEPCLAEGTALAIREALNAMWEGTSDSSTTNSVEAVAESLPELDCSGAAFAEAMVAATLGGVKAMPGSANAAAGAGYQSYAAVDDLACLVLTSSGIDFSTADTRNRVAESEVVQFELLQQQLDLSALAGADIDSDAIRSRATESARYYQAILSQLEHPH